MDNQLCLSAHIQRVEALRFTPAGLPVLVLHLAHESWQEELGERYLARVTLEAKLMGEEARHWQHKEDSTVRVSGFLAHKHQRSAKPVLHIQQIHEI